MAVALGVMLGIGVLLAISPFLWPAREERGSRSASGWRASLRARLAQAGLPQLSLPVLFAVCAIVGLAVAALCFALVSVLALALVAGAVGAAGPLFAITWRARLNRRAARVVWPDVVDHLVSAVRSGLALPDAVATLAAAGPGPVREPFSGFARDYRATGNFGLALDDLKSRLSDATADRILETLRMSREVGGTELVSVLRNLSVYLRQEAAIRSEVEARQSWVRNAARLGVAAPWVVLLLLASRPEAAAAYNSAAGGVLIVSGLAVSVVAYRVMVAIGRLPEERRWFA